MKITRWVHSGFHGMTNIAVMVPEDAEPGDQVQVSKQVAHRLDDAVCGINECSCGDRISYQIHDDNKWYITVPKEV